MFPDDLNDPYWVEMKKELDGNIYHQFLYEDMLKQHKAKPDWFIVMIIFILFSICMCLCPMILKMPASTSYEYDCYHEPHPIYIEVGKSKLINFYDYRDEYEMNEIQYRIYCEENR